MKEKFDLIVDMFKDIQEFGYKNGDKNGFYIAGISDVLIVIDDDTALSELGVEIVNTDYTYYDDNDKELRRMYEFTFKGVRFRYFKTIYKEEE